MVSPMAPASPEEAPLLPQPLEQLNLAGVVGIVGRDAEHQLAVSPATPFGRDLVEARARERSYGGDQPLVLGSEQGHVARPGRGLGRCGLVGEVGGMACEAG